MATVGGLLALRKTRQPWSPEKQTELITFFVSCILALFRVTGTGKLYVKRVVDVSDVHAVIAAKIDGNAASMPG